MDGPDDGGSHGRVHHCRSIFPGGLLTSMMEMTGMAPPLGGKESVWEKVRGRSARIYPLVQIYRTGQDRKTVVNMR